eukprot:scaffold123923_cov17-Prasinocladus_malaysianus.AAC.1
MEGRGRKTFKNKAWEEELHYLEVEHGNLHVLLQLVCGVRLPGPAVQVDAGQNLRGPGPLLIRLESLGQLLPDARHL